jgi:hypothetical protein
MARGRFQFGERKRRLEMSLANPPPLREFSTGCSQGARRPRNFQVDVDPVATPPGACESAFSGARLPVVFERAASDHFESSSTCVRTRPPIVFECAAGARFSNPSKI